MQKYHDEPKQYKGYLKSALALQAPALDPAVALRFERDKAVRWEGHGAVVRPRHEKAQQPLDVRHVTDEHDVARIIGRCFARKFLGYPVRRVIGLQATRCRDVSQCIAGTPERLGRLARAQLAAVPDDRRLGALLRCFLGQLLDAGRTAPRQWSLRVDARRHGLTVVNEI